MYILRFCIHNFALILPVLIDSIVPLEKIWKSFSEFVGVVKPCIAEVLKSCYCSVDEYQPISLVSWMLLVTSLEALCIIFLSFPIPLMADFVSYSVNLLLILETPKSMSDAMVIFDLLIKTPVISSRNINIFRAISSTSWKTAIKKKKLHIVWLYYSSYTKFLQHRHWNFH